MRTLNIRFENTRFVDDFLTEKDDLHTRWMSKDQGSCLTLPTQNRFQIENFQKSPIIRICVIQVHNDLLNRWYIVRTRGVLLPPIPHYKN